MTLGELITALEGANQNQVVALGFSHPHSYRGSYSEVAFAVERGVTVGTMLVSAKEALGTTYQGWKGGSYTMLDTLDVIVEDWKKV